MELQPRQVFLLGFWRGAAGHSKQKSRIQPEDFFTLSLLLGRIEDKVILSFGRCAFPLSVLHLACSTALLVPTAMPSTCLDFLLNPTLPDKVSDYHGH